MIKIATIGGGSSYTPELIEGFINNYNELPIEELWLVDIEEGKEKLEIVGNLAKRMIEKANLPIKIYLTLDRKIALKNATFVTTQFRAGLLDARILDERIPLSFGLIGQETNGAGGMFNAFRTIPIVMDIIKDIKTYCPDAWLINFANPVGAISEAVFRFTDFKKFIGLCNVPITMQFAMEKMMGVKRGELELKIAGLNHHIFVLDCYINGESKMSEVLSKYETLTEKDYIGMKNIMAFPWSKALIRGLKCIPCPYLSYYFFTKEQLEHQLELYSKNNVRAEFVKKIEKELFELYKDPNLKVKPKQLEARGGANYSYAAVQLINSIFNNKKDIQYVNTINRGAVYNLPYESATEIACIITKDGPKPITVGELPVAINGTIQTIKSFERMVAEAAITGDKDLAISALTINPLINSDKLANDVFNALYKAHKKYLPQFK